MIVQVCLNGARPAGYHPALPLDPEAIADDAAAAVDAGAGEIHLHPRGPDGRESLDAVGATLALVRRSCPGTLLGVSTGAWIEGDPARTRAAIAGWTALPDYASVNLSEPDAPAVMDLLGARGVGVEAGLASAADARRFLALPGNARVLRVLIEMDSGDEAAALAETAAIAACLDAAGHARPRLLHGFDATVWRLVDEAPDGGGGRRASASRTAATCPTDRWRPATPPSSPRQCGFIAAGPPSARRTRAETKTPPCGRGLVGTGA